MRERLTAPQGGGSWRAVLRTTAAPLLDTAGGVGANDGADMPQLARQDVMCALLQLYASASDSPVVC
jgi:hypothetical protein